MKSGWKQHSIEECAEALARSHGTVSIAARLLGMSYHGLRRRVRGSPVLQRVIEAEDEALLDLAEVQVWAKVEEGWWPAIRHVLVSKGRRRGWGETLTNEHIGPGGGHPVIGIVPLGDWRSEFGASPLASGPDAHRLASGGAEGARDGPAVGKDDPGDGAGPLVGLEGG